MIQYLSSKLLQRLDWKIVGELPDAKKYIVIIGPHTSNWDFVVGMIVRAALGVRVSFLGKHQLFYWPWGWFFRLLGGQPVVRSRHNNLVDQVVHMYNTHDKFILGLAPEGTRRTINRWRGGFYHIAHQAQIDIVMVGFDFASGEVRIREPFTPCGDVDKDFPIILDYYRNIKGCHDKSIPFHRPAAK